MMNTPGFRLLLIFLFGLCATYWTVDMSLRQHRVGEIFHSGSLVQSSVGSIVLEDIDFTLEPGEFTQTKDLNRFFERQEQISEILLAKPAKSFYLQDLPAIFWIQVMVGFGALLISGWVWSLRPKDLASRFFILSGLTTVMFTYSAAIYTTRELALPSGLFKLLSAVNAIGASFYGMIMVSLFLIYPKRIKIWKKPVVVGFIIFGIWTVLYLVRIVPAWASVNLVTLVEMMCICVAIGVQFFATKKDAKGRAALTWLGLSVLIGAGGFIVMNAVPLIFGLPALDQGYAFLFFLVIYLGLAAGLVRYKLFEVGTWAYRFLFYAVGAGILVALDAALVFVVDMERMPAVGLSLLGVGLMYLPFRDTLWRKLARRGHLDTPDLLSEVLYVALAPSSELRTKRWMILLQQLFDPLEIELCDVPIRNVEICTDGVTMFLPPVAGSPSLKVTYPWAGRKLFSPESTGLARQIVMLIEQAELSRSAYDRGVSEERKRLAQDLHDDVGARLLTGLHNADEKHRPDFQAALSDIRSIVSDIAGENIATEKWVADLRHETSRRLEPTNIEMEWPLTSGGDESQRLTYRQQKVLTSAFREVVSNVIRHSEATHFKVLLEIESGIFKISCIDNGKGFSETTLKGNLGFGLKNISRRIEDIGGSLQLELINGCQIQFIVPLQDEPNKT